MFEYMNQVDKNQLIFMIGILIITLLIVYAFFRLRKRDILDENQELLKNIGIANIPTVKSPEDLVTKGETASFPILIGQETYENQLYDVYTINVQPRMCENFALTETIIRPGKVKIIKM